MQVPGKVCKGIQGTKAPGVQMADAWLAGGQFPARSVALGCPGSGNLPLFHVPASANGGLSDGLGNTGQDTAWTQHFLSEV